VNEVWKTVEDYPDYEVSSTGQVRSANGLLVAFPHGRYYKVSLVPRPGVHRQVAVHILVLEAFIGPKLDGYEGHHKDENRSNNSVENLEWLTTKNHRKAHRKLTKEECFAIDLEYSGGGISQQRLANRYGVGIATINRIVNGRK
jgi:hypothetical protein